MKRTQQQSKIVNIISSKCQLSRHLIFQSNRHINKLKFCIHSGHPRVSVVDLVDAAIRQNRCIKYPAKSNTVKYPDISSFNQKHIQIIQQSTNFCIPSGQCINLLRINGHGEILCEQQHPL